MTDLITEARELCEKATPGPWRKVIKGNSIQSHALEADVYLGAEGFRRITICSGISPKTQNAAFISRSRTLIPALCDALEKANAEIARLREAQRWIPVSERLPTERGYYLVVVKRIAPDELGGNNTRVKIMRWMGEDWRYPVHIPEWINEAITETVTHWQPLPAAPKGDKRVTA